MNKGLEAVKNVKDYIEDNIDFTHNHVEGELNIIEQELKDYEELKSVARGCMKLFEGTKNRGMRVYVSDNVYNKFKEILDK